VAQVSRVTDHLRKGKFASLSGLPSDQGIVLWFVGPVRPILFPGPSPLGSGGGPFLCRTILALDLSVQLRQIVQARLTAGRSFGVSSARNCWKPDMSNPPNECRRQVLACVRLAQASSKGSKCIRISGDSGPPASLVGGIPLVNHSLSPSTPWHELTIVGGGPSGRRR
jgi:hypothetical protein